MGSCPRIMLAAQQSGGGKTTVACGILKALINKNYKPAAFKCGPDYIDTMFHTKATGTPCHNLDLFLADEEIARGILSEYSAGCDISVIEGVMGYYDGIGGCSDKASSWHLATATQTPTILIINARGASLSLAASVNGFLSFRTNSMIKALLLNNCSETLYNTLKPMLEKETGIKVIGYIPYIKEISFESRHLGLITADEVVNIKGKIEKLAEVLSQTVDIDQLISIANTAPIITGELPKIQKLSDKPLKLAVANDKAFCFYYDVNLKILTELGCELIFFSPIYDEEIPKQADGIYIGGGYPELYAKQLSENKTMLSSIYNAVANDMPALAECGGFIYLHSDLYDSNGERHKMAGVINAECKNSGSLKQFGYVTLTALSNNMLCNCGESINAHEFHYWNSSLDCGSFTARKPAGGKQWDSIYCHNNLFAGFPHLYFYSNLCFAHRFVKAMIYYKDNNSIE